MNENECKGCVYDLTNRIVTNEERLKLIIENCCHCKRGVKEEYQDMFSDLYEPEG